MRVRRFVAPDVMTAMGKIKAEMGDDAVILHVRTIRAGGFLGFFGKTMSEVTAAIEEKKTPVPHHKAKTIQLYENMAKVMESPLKPESQTQVSQQNQFVAWNAANSEESQPEKILMERTEPVNREVDTASVEEIRELRRAIELMSQEMLQQLEELGTEKKLQGVDKLQEELIKLELDEELVKKILRALVEDLGVDANPAQVKAKVAQELLKLVDKVAPIKLDVDGKKPLIVALVGPTGVGKTTTIAKLAANFCLVEKLNVALLTADTYRVAAVDQLKTFAEIIKVPLEVVVSPSSVRDAIERHLDKDIILIDTAGRSPNSQIQLSELNALLDKAKPDRVFLTMSATTRWKDMLDIVERFDIPSIDSLIFTKLDETTTYGAIVSIVHCVNKPLAYLTIGQSVPEDIVLANPRMVVERILGGVAQNG